MVSRLMLTGASPSSGRGSRASSASGDTAAAGGTDDSGPTKDRNRGAEESTLSGNGVQTIVSAIEAQTSALGGYLSKIAVSTQATATNTQQMLDLLRKILVQGGGGGGGGRQRGGGGGRGGGGSSGGGGGGDSDFTAYQHTGTAVTPYYPFYNPLEAAANRGGGYPQLGGPSGGVVPYYPIWNGGGGGGNRMLGGQPMLGGPGGPAFIAYQHTPAPDPGMLRLGVDPESAARTAWREGYSAEGWTGGAASPRARAGEFRYDPRYRAPGASARGRARAMGGGGGGRDASFFDSTAEAGEGAITIGAGMAARRAVGAALLGVDLAIEAGEFAWKLPDRIGEWGQTKYGQMQSVIEMDRLASHVARGGVQRGTGGSMPFNYQNLLDQMPTTNTPQWMLDAGVSRIDVLRAINSLGQTTGGGKGAFEAGRDVILSEYLPGLSSLGESARTGYARQMLSLGNSGFRGTPSVFTGSGNPGDPANPMGMGSQVGDNMMFLSRIMEMLPEGLDRSVVLRNIMQATNITASTSSGTRSAIDSSQQLVGRSMMVDTPYARSGALAADYESATRGAVNNQTNTATGAIASIQEMNAYRSEDKLKELLGSENYEQFKASNPNVIGDFLSSSDPAVREANWRVILNAAPAQNRDAVITRFRVAPYVNPNSPRGRWMRANILGMNLGALNQADQIPGAPAPSSAVQKQRMADEVAHLMSKFGMTADQAAGVVGTMYGAESGLDPNNINSTSGAYGIAQWTRSRKKALFDYAAQRGLAPNSWQVQRDFLDYEFEHDEAGTLRAVKGTKTMNQAAYTFGSLGERWDPTGQYDPNSGYVKRSVSGAYAARQAYQSAMGRAVPSDEDGDHATRIRGTPALLGLKTEADNQQEEEARNNVEKWKTATDLSLEASVKMNAAIDKLIAWLERHTGITTGAPQPAPIP